MKATTIGQKKSSTTESQENLPHRSTELFVVHMWIALLLSPQIADLTRFKNSEDSIFFIFPFDDLAVVGILKWEDKEDGVFRIPI